MTRSCLISRASAWLAVLLLGLAGFLEAMAVDLQAAEPPAVAGTIYPLYDMIRVVGGAHVAAKVILPPGASPHLFEFSPRQLEGLRHVKAIFAIGHGLDDWATQVATVAPGVRIIIVDRGIPLRTFEDGTTDPHYWLHLGNARRIAETIATGLSDIDPANAAAYRAAAEAYQRQLSDEERRLMAVLAPARGMPILTFHDAWYYFADEFGLTIAGTFEPAAGQEPTPRYLASLQRTIARERIRILFIEPQMSSGVVRSFAEDNHLGIAVLDPLEGGEGRSTYLDLMAYNANVIRRALQPSH
ncbi:MAG TPA: metal ABC transporter substrate-binding protein [Nitrospiria bacterium]|nr:metal ABC transporter substrate-binding protein [Nitrospiria bacterium]